MGHCAVPDIQLFNLFCSKPLLITVNDPNCHKIASDPIFTLIQEKNTVIQNMTFFESFSSNSKPNEYAGDVHPQRMISDFDSSRADIFEVS